MESQRTVLSICRFAGYFQCAGLAGDIPVAPCCGKDNPICSNRAWAEWADYLSESRLQFSGGTADLEIEELSPTNTVFPVMTRGSLRNHSSLDLLLLPATGLSCLFVGTQGVHSHSVSLPHIHPVFFSPREGLRWGKADFCCVLASKKSSARW
jgi:hypothetical protein